jgi:hypothetical protein
MLHLGLGDPLHVRYLRLGAWRPWFRDSATTAGGGKIMAVAGTLCSTSPPCDFNRLAVRWGLLRPPPALPVRQVRSSSVRALRCLTSGWPCPVMLFGVKLKLLPFHGIESVMRGSGFFLLGGSAAVMLPTFCLTYGALAFLSRFVRGSSLEVISRTYPHGARLVNPNRVRARVPPHAHPGADPPRVAPTPSAAASS